MPELPQSYIAYRKAGGPTSLFLTCDFPGYVDLWPIDEIPRLNGEYEVSVFAPGFLCFGGADGELLAFDENGHIFCMPAIGMDLDNALLVAQSWGDFERFIERET